jgi:hypothetical protein
MRAGHWKMGHTMQGFVFSQVYLFSMFYVFGLWCVGGGSVYWTMAFCYHILAWRAHAAVGCMLLL